MSPEQVTSKRIGEILKEKGFVTDDQLQKALKNQEVSKKRLGQVLMEMGHVTEDQIAECLGQQLGIPYIALRFYQIDDHVLELIPADMAARYRLIPMDRIGEILTVAISDGLTEEEIAEIEKMTNCHLKFYFITVSDFDYGYEVLYARKMHEGKEVA